MRRLFLFIFTALSLLASAEVITMDLTTDNYLLLSSNQSFQIIKQ